MNQGLLEALKKGKPLNAVARDKHGNPINDRKNGPVVTPKPKPPPAPKPKASADSGKSKASSASNDPDWDTPDPNAPTPEEKQSFAEKLNAMLGGNKPPPGPAEPKTVRPTLTPEQQAEKAKIADAQVVLAKAERALAALRAKGQAAPKKKSPGGGSAFENDLAAAMARRIAALRGVNKHESDSEEEPASPEDIAAAEKAVENAQAELKKLLPDPKTPAAPAPPPLTPLPDPPRGGKSSKLAKADFSLADMKMWMEGIRAAVDKQADFSQPGEARTGLALLVRGLTQVNWNLNELTVLARYASTQLRLPEWNDYMAIRLGEALSKEDPEPFHLTGLIELYNAPGVDKPSIHKLVLDVLDHGAVTWNSEDWADAYGEFYVAGSDWYDYAQDAATNWIKVRREEGDVTADDEAKIEEFITQFGLDDLRTPAAGEEDDDVLQMDLESVEPFQYGANTMDALALIGQMADRSKTITGDPRAAILADPDGVAALKAIHLKLKGEPASWPEKMWQHPATQRLLADYQATGSLTAMGMYGQDPGGPNAWVKNIREHDPKLAARLDQVEQKLKAEQRAAGQQPFVNAVALVSDPDGAAIIREWESARPTRDANLLKAQVTDVRKALSKMGRNDLMAKFGTSDQEIVGLLKRPEFREAVADYNEERKLRYVAKETGSVALNDAIRDADESSKVAGSKWLSVARQHPEYETEMAKLGGLITKAQARRDLGKLVKDLDLLAPGFQDRDRAPIRIDESGETLATMAQADRLARAGFRPVDETPKKVAGPGEARDELVGTRVAVVKAVKAGGNYVGIEPGDDVLVTAMGKSNYYVVKTKPDGKREEGWVPKDAVGTKKGEEYSPPSNPVVKYTPLDEVLFPSTAKPTSQPKSKPAPGPPPPDPQALLSAKKPARPVSGAKPTPRPSSGNKPTPRPDSGSKPTPRPNSGNKPTPPPGPAPPPTPAHEPDDDDPTNPLYENWTPARIEAHLRAERARKQRQKQRDSLQAKAQAIYEAKEALKPKPPSPGPRAPSPDRPGPEPVKTPGQAAAEARAAFHKEKRRLEQAELDARRARLAAAEEEEQEKAAKKEQKKAKKIEKRQKKHDKELAKAGGPSTPKPTVSPEMQAMMDKLEAMEKSMALMAAASTPVNGAPSGSAAGAYVPDVAAVKASSDPSKPFNYGSIPGGGGGGYNGGGGGGGSGWDGY